MKTTLSALLLLSLTTFGFADSYFALSDVIKDTYDVVVYGTARFPGMGTLTNDDTCVIDHYRNGELQQSRRKMLRQLVIQPYNFLPDESPRYYWRYEYAILLQDAAFQQLIADKTSYAQRPRFWGIRRTHLFGDLGLPLTVRESDERFRALQNTFDTEWSDPRRIRPLDLRPVATSLTLSAERLAATNLFGTAGQATLVNDSDFYVWLRRLRTPKPTSEGASLEHSVTALRDRNWLHIGYDDISSHSADATNVAFRVDPHSQVDIAIELPPKGKYEAYRVELVVYPSEAFMNSLTVTSGAVE